MVALCIGETYLSTYCSSCFSQPLLSLFQIQRLRVVSLYILVLRLWGCKELAFFTCIYFSTKYCCNTVKVNGIMSDMV